MRVRHWLETGESLPVARNVKETVKPTKTKGDAYRADRRIRGATGVMPVALHKRVS